MALTLKANSAEARELIPPGTYKGLLIGIYDIGTEDGQYGPRHQLILSWELHKKGLLKPYVISKFYGLSFNAKSTLRKDIEAMLGKTFRDGEEMLLEQLIQTPCRIQIVHGKRQDGTPRDEIKSLMPLDDDEPEPPLVGILIYFEIEHMNCDIPSEIPQWIQERIRRSPEWTGTAETAREAKDRKAEAASGNGHKFDSSDADCPY